MRDAVAYKFIFFFLEAPRLPNTHTHTTHSQSDFLFIPLPTHIDYKTEWFLCVCESLCCVSHRLQARLCLCGVSESVRMCLISRLCARIRWHGMANHKHCFVCGALVFHFSRLVGRRFWLLFFFFFFDRIRLSTVSECRYGYGLFCATRFTFSIFFFFCNNFSISMNAN